MRSILIFLQYFGSVPSTNRALYLSFILVLILRQIFVFRFKIMWRSKTELLFFTRDLLASRQMEIERWFLQASL